MTLESTAIETMSFLQDKLQQFSHAGTQEVGHVLKNNQLPQGAWNGCPSPIPQTGRTQEIIIELV